MLSTPLKSNGSPLKDRIPKRSRKATTLVVIILSTLFGACSDNFAPLRPSEGRDSNGIVAFVRSRGRDTEILALDLDTSVTKSLTSGPGVKSSPAWSPEGAFLAYACRDSEGFNICTRALKEDTAHQITAGRWIDGSPSWSPDGTRLAFSSNRGADHLGFSVFVMETDGTGMRRLADGTNPAWSPDGEWIAFVDVEDSANIYIIHPDGTDLQLVVDGPYEDLDPSWSPSGSLAFASDREGNFDIFVTDIDSGEVKHLSSGPADDRAPAWSPDGKLIAFGRAYQDAFDIWIMKADGNQPRQITNDPLYDVTPAWQPKRIDDPPTG